MYNIIEVIIGLAACILIFYKQPGLQNIKLPQKIGKISVIIPARNEEDNLRNLLSDLNAQTRKIDEIVCVDDNSEDKTAETAEEFNVRVIKAGNLPSGWTGKNWACHCGVEGTSGEILLFLDADVRLHKDAIAKLEATFDDCQCTISVQPFHQIKKWYEYFSYFFNLIQISANGIGWPFWSKNAGLFGPVIMISRKDYIYIGGHESVKSCILEDVSLGEQIKKHNLNYKLFLGKNDIQFRMYRNGLAELIEGWTKNMATGALKTPVYLILLIILWFDAITSVFANLIRSSLDRNSSSLLIYSLIYLLTMVILWLISRRVGNFRWGALLYPVLLAACFVIFIISVFKKFVLRRTTWKGRNVDLGVNGSCK